MQSLKNKEISELLGITLKSQTIELSIEGNLFSTNFRNLEETEEQIRIMGDSFNGFNPDDAFIYVDGKRVTFDKNIMVKYSTNIKVVIKFSQKIATFKEMFSGCQRIREVSLKDVETELVFETTSMFEGCTSLSEVKFENMSIANITSTAKMFQKCSSLNIIEIETFSTDKTKDMSKMFDGCSSFDNSTFIEGLSTNSAENMDEMFSGCSEIKSLDSSGFNTRNVKNMSGMFKGMTSLEELEIRSFHTEKVEFMSEMFESCSSIINLNLSNFNTDMVINMDRMFSSCLNLETVDLTSFSLKSCNSTEQMFTNTTRQLMLSIEKNENILIRAGGAWSENELKYFNITKIPLDLLFLVDATGSMVSIINQVKEKVVYIAANILNKTGMETYNLSLGAIFYRDPINSPNSPYHSHEIFDFDINALNFRNSVSNISAKGGGDGPEDWAGAYNLAKNLSWRNDSFKLIIHIADAPAHGYGWINPIDDDELKKYPEEGNKTDEIIRYFAQNNFSIVGFKVNTYGYVNGNYASSSFLRAQKIFRENGNFNYFFKYFDESRNKSEYFFDLVYESFQKIKSVSFLQGIDVSEEQGLIDWENVKNKNKIDFVIIRAGIGNEIDNQF